MTDLLTLMYPDVAGFKEGLTSREAAEAIEAKGRAGHLRDAVAAWYAKGWTGTADECAAALNESILAIRPRVSELHMQHVLEPTGHKRRSTGGRPSHVWRAA